MQGHVAYVLRTHTQETKCYPNYYSKSSCELSAYSTCIYVYVYCIYVIVLLFNSQSNTVDDTKSQAHRCVKLSVTGGVYTQKVLGSKPAVLC